MKMLALLATTAALVINPDTAVWVIHPDDTGGVSARRPVALALRDAKRDWYKVLGAPPAVIVSDATGAAALPDGFDGVAFFLGAAAAPFGAHLKGEEEHALVFEPPKTHNTPTIIAAAGGRHVRGSVYAIYALCERLLGVEPLWYWADLEPEYRGALVLDAAAVPYKSGEPAFRRRGVFPNDEDLLGGFRPDPLGESVFSVELWDKFLEALLRLKGNLIIPGTVAFPDEACYEIAAARGVAVSQQHFTLLGVNTWRWPVGVPYSFDRDREIQDYVWRASLDAYAGRETVWTVGYRGLNDYPFWTDEPSFNTSASRGKLISAAMAHQTALVRGTPGRGADEIVTYMWAEALDLYLSGDLALPPNTTRVWADTGSGSFDPSVFPHIAEGDGVYYHTQMENPGYYAQLTEMTPPAAFLGAAARFVKARATSLFVLNLSDLKPALFSTDLVLRYLWDPAPFSTGSIVEQQTRAIAAWCGRVFGRAHAAEAASLMAGYYNISYIAGTDTDRRGEQNLAGEVRRLLANKTEPADALAFVAGPLRQLRPLHARARALLRAMDAAGARGARLFEASVLLHVAIHLYGCEAVNATAVALGAPERAAEAFDAAHGALQELFASQRAAEGLKWRGLYGNDELDDFFEVACSLRAARALATNTAAPGSCNMPSGRVWGIPGRGTGAWSTWFEYGASSAAFPFLRRSDAWNMDSVVRITCGDAKCSESAVGGSLCRGARVELAAPLADAVVRFTLDGSDPNPNAPPYRDPIALSATTDIAAAVFTRNGSSGLVTRSTFTVVDSPLCASS